MNFLDERELQEIEVVRLLGQEKRYWQMNEIASSLDYKIDMVYRAVDSIKLHLEHNIPNTGLIIKKNIGVYLHKPDDLSVNAVIEKYITSSFAYSLIDNTFKYRYLRAKPYYDQNFITKSTFYIKLKRFQKIVRTIGLDIETNPLQITGPEVWIREFYYQCYWRVYNGRVWPFTSISKEILIYQLNDFLQKSNTYIHPIEKEQLLYRLAVKYMRHAQKFYITEMPLENAVPPDVVKFMKKHGTPLIGKVPMPFKDMEEKYLTIAISSSMYAKASDLNSATLIRWHRQKQSLPYKLAEIFLNEFRSYYPDITIDSSDHLWLNLINANFYGLSLPHLLVYRDIPAQINYFKEDNPSLWRNLDTITSEMFHPSKVGIDTAPYIYFCYKYMVLITEKFDMKKYEPLLKIKLFTSQDDSVLNKLGSQLLQKLYFNLEIITNEDRPTNTADLTISDVAIDEVNPTHTFIWNFPPTQGDWVRLEERLKEIRDGKLGTGMD